MGYEQVMSKEMRVFAFSELRAWEYFVSALLRIKRSGIEVEQCLSDECNCQDLPCKKLL